MAQILKPAADAVDGAWVPSSGADLYATIDEAVADDGDFIYVVGSSECEVDLEAGSDPGVDTGHILRYRAFGDGVHDLRVSLWDNSGTPFEVVAFTELNLAPGVQAFAETLDEAVAATITSGGYAALSIKFASIERVTGAMAADGEAAVDLVGTTAGGGPTILTIKSSGGDYTTVASWEADTDNDMTGLGEVVGEIYDVNTTSAITIAGATNTSAADFRHLTVNSAYRHAGVWDTGKTNIQVSAGGSRIVVLSEAYAKASYLQAENTHASSSGVYEVDANNCLFDSCIGWLATRGGWGGDDASVFYLSGAYTGWVFRNCIAWYGRYGFNAANASASGEIQNCDSVDNSVSGLRTAAGTTLTVRNTYCGGNTSTDYNEGGSANVSWTIQTSMNADSNSTETGLTNGIAYDTSNFTTVTAGGPNLHLTSGSALRNAGTDLSGTFTNDIDGGTRSAWDVGADEF